MRRSSRELSSRVSIDVHRQPNWHRRSAWWLALYAGVGSLLWLSMQYLRGQNRIYQAGDVASAHRMFENECWRCHTTWTPLQRLISLNDELHSTSNQKCETCHLVSEHQPHQVPAHRNIACAECHQEHQGAAILARPSDRFCISCHRDLKAHGGKGTFANNVTGFDVPGGHPEFLLTKLLNGEASESPVSKSKNARSLDELPVAKFLRPGVDEAPRWQDRGRIRFNHARHLHARYDNGVLVEGLINENRELVDLSSQCDACHQPDVDRRFFKPIQFETHCCRCHPLLFDPARFPRQSVPHELPEIVRGFLTETYTLRALRKDPAPAAADPQRFCAALNTQQSNPFDNTAHNDVDQPRRTLPGHRDLQKLTPEKAEAVLADVAQAEAVAMNHRQRLFGFETAGGCRHCHEMELNSEGSTDEWRIVPPRIPSRWLPHGEFHHEPHRLLSCGVCHVGVTASENTGDVLIPSRDVCVACHASQPDKWRATWMHWFDERQKLVQKREVELAEKRAKWTTQLTESGSSPATTASTPTVRTSQPLSFQELLTNADRGTRTDCIECHNYHNPARDKWNGPFVPTITRTPTPIPNR